MASFRDSSITKSASAHTISPTIPALAVAGDLLVMFVQKQQDDPFNYHTDWEAIATREHGIGTRLSSTCMWKIVTAADISAGSWSINCAPSSSVGKVDVLVVAYDISDWSGPVWTQSSGGYKNDTATSTIVTPASTVFQEGITMVSLSHALISRAGAGVCDIASLRVEADAADTVGIQVYDDTDDVGATGVIGTITTMGTANTYQAIIVAFGPAAAAGEFPPCPDAPDGGRVPF